VINITATNYSVYRPKHAQAVKFGSTQWSTAQFASTSQALDTSYAANNATTLFDAVGITGTSSPVTIAPFAKEITFSGNERSTTEENLIGADGNGTQNQEIGINPTSLQVVEMTLVYRNNVPLSIFNDTTKCCLMQFDNDEGSTSGLLNIGCNNITVLHVGSVKLGSSGLMEQKIKFTFKGGTTGTVITVTDGSESWKRINGGDYSEEVRIA